MTTTFRTNSRDLYESMNRYFHNKRLPLMRLRDDEQFSMSIFNLSNDETEKLIALLLDVAAQKCEILIFSTIYLNFSDKIAIFVGVKICSLNFKTIDYDKRT